MNERADLPLPRRSQNVLFASANGIGLGHLARQMAVASRLGAGQKAVFFTMSYAFATVLRSGYLCFAMQHHLANGIGEIEWNKALGEDYRLLVDTLKPKAFVYDATAVFGGTVDLLLSRPKLESIWIRRAMWRPIHSQFLEHGSRFTTVVEPSELADVFDRGPTKAFQSRVLRVSPVLNIDPGERLARQDVRRLLGLPMGATVICVQLSNGSDFDIAPVKNDLIWRLLHHKDIVVVELYSELNPKPAKMVIDHPRYRAISLFPSYLYSLCWDAAISAAGYNSFHENIIGNIPTLFIPNEGEEMDMQLNRALWAENNGYSLSGRRDEPSGAIADKLERLLDGREREKMISRCRSIAWENGALAIAHLIDSLPST